MSPQEGTAWQAGADASEVLGPESGLFAQVDPAEFGRSVLSVLSRAAEHPDDVRNAWLRFTTAMAEAWPAAVGHWLGEDGEPPVPVNDRDKRFADPAWNGNPGYFALRQAYLAARRLGEDLLAAGQGDRLTDQKARLAVGLAFDALAPTNFLPTNPAALKRAFDTGGASVAAGVRNFLVDLAPERSFIEWAVQHRRTVFAISYRNPDATMSDVTLDDYIVHGPKTALDVISDITGSPKVDIVGLCLGGTITAMLAAYLAETGDDRIGSVTLLNTLLDFSEPGVLGAFADERTIERLDARMARTGVMEGSTMAGTFDVLRANDLIFSYVVSNWLMGEDPPAFDILAWNADSTRLPAAMHAFYLRALYRDNQLAKAEMELAGQILSLADVKSDTYIVGAVNDHIVPWPGSYESTRLLGGTVRFVLSSGGHIAGIVNPPGPKAWYEAGEHSPEDPARWREAAKRHEGSWWEDWTRWADGRAGRLVPPPPMGSDRYPATGEAPGEYVRG